MQLHQLKPIHKNRKSKRVGRGGKRGTYSSRGMKGQKRAFYEAHIQKPKEYQELANAYEINIPYTPKYAVSN